MKPLSVGSKIIVVGAGIVGVATAVHLLRRNYSVTLVDRADPGDSSATSYGNAGVLATGSLVPVTVPSLFGNIPSYLLSKDSPLFLKWTHLPKMAGWLPRYLKSCFAANSAKISAGLAPLTRDSVAEHRGLWNKQSGSDLINDVDYAFVYSSQKSFKSDKFIWDLRTQHGIEWDIIKDSDIFDYEPNVAREKAKLIVRMKNHGGVVDPGRYVSSLAEEFVGNGGVFKKASVAKLNISEGKITGVVTDTGDQLAGESVVLTAGVWSAALTKQAGLHTPIESERGYHVEFPSSSGGPVRPTMIASSKFIIHPMAGRVRCAGLVEFAGLDAPKNQKAVDLLTRQAKEHFPALDTDNTQSWLGHRPAPPDSLPYLGEAPNIEGLICAFGHHHIGLTTSARTGRVVADIVSGRSPDIDLTPYQVDRFS